MKNKDFLSPERIASPLSASKLSPSISENESMIKSQRKLPFFNKSKLNFLENLDSDEGNIIILFIMMFICINIIFFFIESPKNKEDLDGSLCEYVEENELDDENMNKKRQSRRKRRRSKERRYSRISLRKEVNFSKNLGIELEWGININED